jgi:hypothetical protein
MFNLTEFSLLLSGTSLIAIPIITLMVYIFMKVDSDGIYKIRKKDISPIIISWVIMLLVFLFVLFIAKPHYINQ